MTDEEIAKRIAQGEDSRTQFKRGPVGVAKLAAELKKTETANEAIKNVYEVAKGENEVVKGENEVAKGENEVVKGENEAVIEVVKKNPGIRKPRLVPLVGKSRATVERMIAHLIKVGKIEFRGAPKNGGYYLKEQK